MSTFLSRKSGALEQFPYFSHLFLHHEKYTEQIEEEKDRRPIKPSREGVLCRCAGHFAVEVSDHHCGPIIKRRTLLTARFYFQHLERRTAPRADSLPVRRSDDRPKSCIALLPDRCGKKGHTFN
ncbi:hypothetical protein J6590_001204 [Homalodisca vitripennis]|nr:hypothetical protein J6590_001204 [Homalodisca vitripennis]